MKALRVLLPVLVLGILVLVPQAAFAASATFFGPIIPDQCLCDAAHNNGVQSAPDFGCVLATAENLMNFAISIGVIIFVLVAAYAGLLLMFSTTNSHNKETAKGILTNAVIGLLIALSAWLMVDFIMKTLYNGQWGPWNSILGDGGQYCLLTHEAPSLGANVNGGGTGVDQGNTPSAVPTPVSSPGTGANCPVPAESTMVSFPSEATSGGTKKATQATVTNFMSMRAAAAADGIDLKVVSAYRSDADQVAQWNSHNCDAAVDHCVGRVAKPCSLPGGTGSNHNSGQAVDINDGCSPGNTSCNTPAYNWLKAHAAQYNFRNALPKDLVHWSPNGH